MVKFRPVAAAALSSLLGLGIVWCADAHAERHLFNAYDLLAWCESASQVKRAECVGYLKGVLSGASEAELERGGGEPRSFASLGLILMPSNSARCLWRGYARARQSITMKRWT